MLDDCRNNYQEYVAALRSINSSTSTLKISEPIVSTNDRLKLSESFNIVLRETLTQSFIQLSVLELYSVQFNFPLVN